MRLACDGRSVFTLLSVLCARLTTPFDDIKWVSAVIANFVYLAG